MAIVDCGIINAVLLNQKPYVSYLNHLLCSGEQMQSTSHALVSGHLVIFAKSPVTKTCIRRLQIHLKLILCGKASWDMYGGRRQNSSTCISLKVKTEQLAQTAFISLNRALTSNRRLVLLVLVV
ncbi:hypothetical protein T11_13658 [Trichinella zimbabwensis]|uniref:Uncharacterized protein n=1 Tax=Trichinella zimbabwensis TaxID=268475 RepID=A0A0V1I2K7_9BILA|nr:hypothetical protein T11_13658 [Trichinella zimbabwensis]